MTDYGHDEAMRDLEHLAQAYERAFRAAPSEHVASDNLAAYIENLEKRQERVDELVHEARRVVDGHDFGREKDSTLFSATARSDFAGLRRALEPFEEAPRD